MEEIIEEEEELEAMVKEIEESGDDAMQEGQLSLNAMWGSRSNQTMIIKVSYRKMRMYILIDTSSTHNFINEGTVKQLMGKCRKLMGCGLRSLMVKT